MNARTTPTSRPTLGVFGRLGRWSASAAVRSSSLGGGDHCSRRGCAARRARSVRRRLAGRRLGVSCRHARLIERHFGGQGSYALAVVVSSARHTAGDPAFRHAIETAAERAAARPGCRRRAASAREASRSRADGHVAVVRGGAGADTAEMVRAAGRVQKRLGTSAPGGVQLALTGSAALWSQFNEENKAAMLRSEITSWPLTLAVLLVAFGSLAAAGIPLLLSILGARRRRRRALDRQPAHRDHDLGDELRPDVRARGGHRLCAVRRRALPGGASRGAAPARRGRRDDGQRRQGGGRQRSGRTGIALAR